MRCIRKYLMTHLATCSHIAQSDGDHAKAARQALTQPVAGQPHHNVMFSNTGPILGLEHRT
jgi:hypothetical protein